jgi:hypothetical protein
MKEAMELGAPRPPAAPRKLSGSYFAQRVKGSGLAIGNAQEEERKGGSTRRLARQETRGRAVTGGGGGEGRDSGAGAEVAYLFE